LKKRVLRLKGNQYVEAVEVLSLMIRQAQKIVRKKIKSHYFEPTNERPKTEEHLIPQNQLIDAFIHGKITFEECLSMPIVKLGPSSNRKLEAAGLQNFNSNWINPFFFFFEAGIEENIILPFGRKIKFDTFSLMDHFKIYGTIKL